MVYQELLDKLKRMYPGMSKAHKKVAEAILESWESVAFLSPRELGERLDVSEATVIRLAQELGYKNYSEFREYVRELVKLKLTPAEKMSSSLQELDDHEHSLYKILNRDLENFKNGIPKVSPEEFAKAVELIENARRVFLIGFGVSTSLCYFLDFRLRRMQIDTRLLTHGDKYFFEQLLLIRPNDLLIGFGFFRCAEEILEAFNYAQTQQVKSIAITHSSVSELARLATVTLVANRGPVSEINSLVMPMAVLNALVLSLAEKEGAKGLEALERLDQVRKYSLSALNPKKGGTDR